MPANSSTSPVLLVVLVAQLAMTYPLRVVLPLAVVANLAVYLMVGRQGHPNPPQARPQNHLRPPLQQGEAEEAARLGGNRNCR